MTFIKNLYEAESCQYGHTSEDSKHYILHCSNYTTQLTSMIIKFETITKTNYALLQL